MKTYRPERIISGGQTGIDQLGLDVARSLGIATGGVAPRGYLTETGPDHRLRHYGLTEHASEQYEKRTHANVLGSDGTVLFGNVTAGGTKLTLELCIQENRPYLINPTAGELADWLAENQIRTLNVAGSRAIQLAENELAQYRQVLLQALRQGLAGLC